MSPCTRLSDRMPAVARATADWSAADEAHLARCGDCAFEWALVRRTAGLGSAVVVDLGRVSDGVRTGLRVRAPSRATKIARWTLPVALAAALLLVLARTRGSTPTEPAGVTLSLLPEAEALSDADLESVLRLIPAAEPGLGGIDSLSEEELNQMVDDLEG